MVCHLPHTDVALYNYNVMLVYEMFFLHFPCLIKMVLFIIFFKIALNPNQTLK